ncbi:hypothetical protein RP20_CCG016410 [Aedes albopictus]|nr:hypothetical protein RP20_CCG016410 [Aedes albopictus]
MDMELKVATIRLNFQNYDLWKQRTKQLLIREGLWRVIADDLPPVNRRTEAWVDKDERAAATIGYLVENSQLQLIKNATTAQETWNVLREYHVRQSSASRVGLVKRLCRLEMEEGGNVEEHMISMDALFDKLAEVGCDIAEEMKCNFIMASLPESYDSFVTMIEGSDGKLTERTVKTKLLNEYYKRQHKSGIQEEKAMKAAVSRSRITSGKQLDKSDDQRVCFECGKPGHIKRNCYMYLSKLAEQQGIDRADATVGGKAKIAEQKVTDRPVCFLAAERSPTREWIIDSGASHHLTSDRSFFTQLEAKSDKLYLANGKVSKIVGVGEGNITGIDDVGNPVEVKLKKVLFVPDLNCNIISVQRVVESKAQVEFCSGKCHVKKDGRAILVGNVINGVYCMKTMK